MALGSLRELDDWQLDDGEEDIVGWPVVDEGGAGRGQVTDLIIDTDRARVVEIVTDRGERIEPERVDIGDKVVVLRAAAGGVSALTGIEPVDMSRSGTSVPGSLGVGAVSEERTRPHICRRAT